LGGYEEFTEKTANVDTDLNPVGTYAPNPLGLYDMTENAAEWVNDWYAKDYYKVSPKLDPQGPETGENKVKRGGIGMVNTSRVHYPLSDYMPALNSGFRCAVQSTEQTY
ncbi:SUMF1/EgtB/PvdO family nonheme iron enzyme, partial [Vibrio sp. Hep-1b-8]